LLILPVLNFQNGSGNLRSMLPGVLGPSLALLDPTYKHLAGISNMQVGSSAADPTLFTSGMPVGSVTLFLDPPSEYPLRNLPLQRGSINYRVCR
jgi:hypothetical protein